MNAKPPSTYCLSECMRQLREIVMDAKGVSVVNKASVAPQIFKAPV